jgi:endonuclease G
MRRRFMVALFTFVVLSSSALGQVHEALKYGAPDTGHIIDYGSFVMSYDGRFRSARWTAEKLTKESLRGDTDRQDDFRPDTRIPYEFRSELSDYKGSGYDRGHQAPSGDHVLSAEINSSTFFLTNMSPQVGNGFNRSYWKNLEDSIRKLAKSADVKELYVFTGPLIMPDDAPPQGIANGTLSAAAKEDEDSDNKASELTVKFKYIGGNHVPVPTHYFKAILVVPQDVQHSLKMYTLILPNRKISNDTSLKDFARSVDYLEHWAGFDLWSAVPADEQKYKEGIAWRPWTE